MNKIETILIDDEPKALAILKNKIERFCPNLEIVAETQNPIEAIQLIKEKKPQLIFLDIAMPEINGFELLKRIGNPTFEIIFATAFDDYAIKAIEHCAIGYLVKPIDNNDLVVAVNNAVNSIQNKFALNKNKLLIENLGVLSFLKKKIVIPTVNGLEFVKFEDVIFFEGVEGYTKIHSINQKPILSSNSIGHFKKLIDPAMFYLVHKSYLINLEYIEEYLNEGYVVLSQNHKIPISRNRKQDFLNHLKI